MASAYLRSPGPPGPDRPVFRPLEPTPQAPGRDVKALHEKLLALRLDLVHGVMPRAERITLTAGDLQYLLVQLDAAIALTRDIVGPDPRLLRENTGYDRTAERQFCPPRTTA